MAFLHNMSGATRPPAVAGLFYPGEPGALREEVRRLLADAQGPRVRPLAIVVPHAGFPYSGPIAATAYAGLQTFANEIKRVVLLGPSHRVGFRGAAVPTVDSFSTPLGEIPLDREDIALLLRKPAVQARDDAHAREHSLEVQLPFLQVVLSDFRLTPLSVGVIAPEEAADLMRPFLGRTGTLVVVSSDLSHYHEYEAAKRMDLRTTEAIVALAFERIESADACGCHALNGLLHLARNTGLSALPLDVRNSGDTAGDHARVVGYGAYAFVRQNGSRE